VNPRFYAALFLIAPFASNDTQSHPLAGKWNIEYVAGHRVENDVSTPVLAKASLALAVVGDSLVGTMVGTPLPGAPARPPSRFAAKRIDGRVTFIVHSEATINRNDEMSTAKVISTWVLSAANDAIEGTVTREIIGVDAPNPGPLAVKGTRVR